MRKILYGTCLLGRVLGFFFLTLFFFSHVHKFHCLLLFFFLDTAHAVFVRATYLVCHRLISSWKSDLNTSLAALEMLGGLARVKIMDRGEREGHLHFCDPVEKSQILFS